MGGRLSSLFGMSGVMCAVLVLMCAAWLFAIAGILG